MSTFRIEGLEKRLDNLSEDHSAVDIQIRSTHNAVHRKRLKRQRRTLTKEIKEVTSNLKTLHNEERRKDLLAEYKAANEQLGYALSAVDRVRIQRQIKNIEDRLNS